VATTKKRQAGDESGAPKKAKAGAARPGAKPAARPGAKPAARPGAKPAARPGARPAARPAAKSTAGKPRIRASHAAVDATRATPRKRTNTVEAASPRRTKHFIDGSVAERDLALSAANKAGRDAPLRKTPLTGPKRPKRSAPAAPTEQSNEKSRELALALASAGLDKKAVGIEILDVTGKVDYADFLVIMTGRSDRHVHAIAMGLDEAMSKLKVAPLSMEGLTASTWVLIDFGDVVVHVFQEDARSMYDIEGLWTDAGRIPVPAEAPEPAPQVQ
jgi:ribosome-associated protein